LKRFGQKVRAADGEIKNTQNCRLKGNESQWLIMIEKLLIISRTVK
jgi:hypothetical protein